LSDESPKNAGTALAPFDCWLMLRGIKTLALRLERSCTNAQKLAAFLAVHPCVTRLYWTEDIAPSQLADARSDVELPEDGANSLLGLGNLGTNWDEEYDVVAGPCGNLVRRCPDRALSRGPESVDKFKTEESRRSSPGSVARSRARAQVDQSLHALRKPAKKGALDAFARAPLSWLPLGSSGFDSNLAVRRKLAVPAAERRLHGQQATGCGALLSFETGDVELSKRFMEACRIFKITVSFGSVNSLVEMPCAMSHASIPVNTAASDSHPGETPNYSTPKIGAKDSCSSSDSRGGDVAPLPADLVRMSVGVEDGRDLVEDVAQAFQVATRLRSVAEVKAYYLGGAWGDSAPEFEGIPSQVTNPSAVHEAGIRSKHSQHLQRRKRALSAVPGRAREACLGEGDEAGRGDQAAGAPRGRKWGRKRAALSTAALDAEEQAPSGSNSEEVVSAEALVRNRKLVAAVRRTKVSKENLRYDSRFEDLPTVPSMPPRAGARRGLASRAGAWRFLSAVLPGGRAERPVSGSAPSGASPTPSAGQDCSGQRLSLASIFERVWSARKKD